MLEHYEKTGSGLEDWELLDKRQVVDLSIWSIMGLKDVQMVVICAVCQNVCAVGETGPPTDYLHCGVMIKIS